MDPDSNLARDSNLTRAMSKLASHLMTKYMLEAQNCRLSLAVKSVPQITNSIARRKNHEAFATEKRFM